MHMAPIGIDLNVAEKNSPKSCGCSTEKRGPLRVIRCAGSSSGTPMVF